MLKIHAMVAKAAVIEDSVAASEVSLYRSLLRIKEEHTLENLGISFYDAEDGTPHAYGVNRQFVLTREP